MTKIDKRYIGDEQIGSEQMELLNNSTFQGQNASGTSSIDLFKVDSSDLLQFLQPINLPAAAISPNEAVRKQELDLISDRLARRYSSLNDVTISTTSATVYSVHNTLVTPSLPLGDYRLDMSAFYNISSTSRFMNLRVQVNGVAIFAKIFNASNNSTTMSFPVSFFRTLAAISGVQTIEISFKLVSTSATVRMLESTLELYQVG